MPEALAERIASVVTCPPARCRTVVVNPLPSPMTFPRLFVLGLVVVAFGWPDPASAQQSRRDRAEERIRERCGDDRACAERMREQLRQRQGGATTDRPAATASVPRLPQRIQRAFEQLPADVQQEIRDECEADVDCYREAIRRERQARQGQGARDQAPREPVLRTPPRTGEAPQPIGGAPSGAGDGNRRAGRSLLDSTTTQTPGGRTPATTGRTQTGSPLPSGPPLQGQQQQRQLPPSSTGTNDAPPAGAGLPGSIRPGMIDPVETDAPAVNQATYFYYDSDETDPTRTSGVGGSYVETRQPGNGAFLVGIESEERSDLPCGWRFLWYRDNDVPNVSQGYFLTKVDECEERVDWHTSTISQESYPSDYAIRSWGSRYHQNATVEFLDDPGDDGVRVVKGVQVCLNNSGDRIKGVSVLGATVDAEGRRTSDSALNGSFERTNCNGDWLQVRECSGGDVAVGIEIDFKTSSATFGATGVGASGMRLICADPYTETR